MSLNDFFEQIYWLNLDRRSDRRVMFERQAKRLGFTAARVKAVDGQDPKLSGKIRNGLRPGEYGCLCGHFSILRDAIERKCKSILVMEDDCILDERLNDKLPDLFKLVPPYWEMLYLGGIHSKLDDTSKPPVRLHKNLLGLRCTLTTVCYAVNGAALEKISHGIETNQPIDVSYAHLQPELFAYGFWPNLAWQESGYSDIQDCEVNYEYQRPLNA